MVFDMIEQKAADMSGGKNAERFATQADMDAL
jgi:hypothetical protein